MTHERIARLASVLALTLLAGLVATSVTATPAASAPEHAAGPSQALDSDGVALHPTPTEEPSTTTTRSTPSSPPTGGVAVASTRDLLLVVGGFLTGGALVGAGVVAGRWSK